MWSQAGLPSCPGAAAVTISTPQVEAFLTELYHGKPKACDLARFMEKKSSLEVQENRVTLDDIQSTMAQLRKEVTFCVLLLLSSYVPFRHPCAGS